MKDYMTPADRLRACGEALFGSTWQSELARALDLSVEGGIIRKMASGRAGITDRTWARIANLMQEKRQTLIQLVPVADPQSATALAIREALRDVPDVAAGCLIGLGHFQLGHDLLMAAEAAQSARDRYFAMETRPVTDADRAQNPLVDFATRPGIPLDAEKDQAAWDAMVQADARLNQIKAEARSIADSLDGGYDGVP